MATHSSVLAWRIPGTEEPGGPLSIGSQSRTRLKRLSMYACMHWRRKWQLIPIFLPGESQGQRSLMGCRLWGRTESDATEATLATAIPFSEVPKTRKSFKFFPNSVVAKSDLT